MSSCIYVVVIYVCSSVYIALFMYVCGVSVSIHSGRNFPKISQAGELYLPLLAVAFNTCLCSLQQLILEGLCKTTSLGKLRQWHVGPSPTQVFGSCVSSGCTLGGGGKTRREHLFLSCYEWVELSHSTGLIFAWELDCVTCKGQCAVRDRRFSDWWHRSICQTGFYNGRYETINYHKDRGKWA